MNYWNEHKELLNKELDSLYLAYLVKEYGLPEDKEDRVKILLQLNKSGENIYKINYFKLCDCCKEFKDTYPFMERVLPLIQNNIKSQASYIEEINHSNLEDEEKALLLFVLPLDNA